MAHFLYMTRHGYYREGYQAEWEPDTDDTDSFIRCTDSESEIGEEVLPRTVHECNIMEVEGKDIGADDIAAGIFPAKETDDDEVARPTRHVRKDLDSDSDEDGNAEAGPSPATWDHSRVQRTCPRGRHQSM